MLNAKLYPQVHVQGQPVGVGSAFLNYAIRICYVKIPLDNAPSYSE